MPRRVFTLAVLALASCTYSLDSVQDAAPGAGGAGSSGAGASQVGGAASGGHAGAAPGGQAQGGQGGASVGGQSSAGQSGQTSAGQSGQGGTGGVATAGQGGGGGSAGAASSGGGQAGGAAGSGGVIAGGNGGFSGTAAGAGGDATAGAAGSGGADLCSVTTAPACDPTVIASGVDDSNCGACGRACATFKHCHAGVCDPDPLMGGTDPACSVQNATAALSFAQGGPGELLFSSEHGEGLPRVCKFYASGASPLPILNRPATVPPVPNMQTGPGANVTVAGGGRVATLVQWAYTTTTEADVNVYDAGATAPLQAARLNAENFSANSFSGATTGTNSDVGAGHHPNGGEELRPLAIDENWVFVWDLGAVPSTGQQYLRRLPIDGKSGFSDFFGPVPTIARFVLHGGQVYVLARLQDSDPWIIYAMAEDAAGPLAVGSTGVTSIVIDQPDTQIEWPTSMVADSNALYISDAGASKGSAQDGHIVRYDLRPGCGGAKSLMSGIYRPFGLTVDDTYVAWAEHGTPYDTTSTSADYRIVRSYQDGTGRLELFAEDPTWTRNTQCDEIEIGLGHDGAGNVYFAPGSQITYQPDQPSLPISTDAPLVYGNVFRLPL